MSEIPKHFNVFYAHTCELETLLNDLYIKGFSVIQVFPTGKSAETKNEGHDATICAEVAIVSIKLPSLSTGITPNLSKKKVEKKPAKAFSKKAQAKLDQEKK